MTDHNRWTPDCRMFRPATGSATQYLVDSNRGETCVACVEEGSAT